MLFYPRVFWALFGVVILLCTAGAAEEKPVNVPGGGEAVIDGSPAKAAGHSSVGQGREAVAVEGQPFSRALLVKTAAAQKEWWDLQCSFRTTSPVAKGDVLLASFYVRSRPEPGGAKEPSVLAYFQLARDPYTKSMLLRVPVDATWRRVFLPFISAGDYAPGQAALAFGFGGPVQAVEIGGVELLNYGKKAKIRDLPRTRFGYEGDQPDAAWRKAAAARIEKIRKGDLTVTVVDAAGNPIPGATVDVKMTKHAFPFGSAVSSGYMHMWEKDPKAVEQYQKVFLENFNAATIENGLKWPRWEEKPYRAGTFKTLAWLKDNRIPVHGHVLVWPGWKVLPKRLAAMKDDPEKLRAAVREHVAEEAAAVRGQVVEWDVINEPTTNHHLMDILGEKEMAEWFKLARKADPDARLMINEYNIITENGRHAKNIIRIIKLLQAEKAPIQAVGVQAHISDPVGIPEVLSRLDEMAKLGLPLRITEYDYNTNDEPTQAQYMRDFMTAMFSHPAVDGFFQWGFWEGAHWRTDCAMYRRDWSIKPNGKAYRQLVFGDWWTEETGRTDAKGQFSIRGFLGDYAITVTHDGKTARAQTSLPKSGALITVKMP